MSRWREHLGQALGGLLTGRLTLRSDAIPYTFTGLPRRKVLNALLTESSVAFKPSRAWGRPTHLMVEPTSCCNLRCSLCPVTAGLARGQGVMSMDTFTRVLDEAGDGVFTLLLWGWGEPFLNPRVFDMIAYAKGKGVVVISSTNGHLFARAELADRLVRSGIDSIIFAIDGVTQASYQRFRQGGTLETALAGIRNVVERKRALGSATPLVNFRFIVMAQNEGEIPRVNELAASLGVDALTFKTLNPDNEDPYTPLAEEITGGRAFVPRDEHYRRFRRGPHGEPRQRRRHNPCKHLWTHPVIHWDGTVVSCSYDPDEQFPLGNVRTTPLLEIWNGPAYRELRRQFRRDWRSVPRCKDCSYAFAGGSCTHEIVAEALFFPPRT